MVFNGWLTNVTGHVWQTGVIPLHWKKGIILPIYDGKGSPKERSNYRGITFLSMPGKVFATVLLNKVRDRAVAAAICKPPSDWKRPPGRPNHTWLRAIELDLRPLNIGPSYA